MALERVQGKEGTKHYICFLLCFFFINEREWATDQTLRWVENEKKENKKYVENESDRKIGK